ncbi:hypothetical protein [Methanosarcina vacuolata]|uniref:hypothetical protein n=1 Tax=Methanosarcina vacuolata TaxID=2215 RepID=UPI00064FB273|nr:hypothetical protein [Methanosarcina vacuolata]
MPVKPLWIGTGKINTEGKESVTKRIIFGRFKAINVQIAGQKNPKNPKNPEKPDFNEKTR